MWFVCVVADDKSETNKGLRRASRLDLAYLHCTPSSQDLDPELSQFYYAFNVSSEAETEG